MHFSIRGMLGQSRFMGDTNAFLHRRYRLGNAPFARYHARMTKSLYPLILVLLCACSIVQAQPEAMMTLLPTTSVTAASLIPTATRALQPIAQDTATPNHDCQNNAERLAVQHTVWAELDYSAHTVSVRHLVDFLNHTSSPLSEIVLNVEANRWQGALTITEIALFNAVPPYTLAEERLSITLPSTLMPDCALRFEMLYTLNVPLLGDGVNAYKGYFSYTQEQLNLGHWLASAAVYQNETWITHHSNFIGEQSILAVADWDVTLTVNNAPDSLIVAAPGEVTELDTNQWHFVHRHARDFSMSLSAAFSFNHLQTVSGVSVELYSLADARIVADDGHIIDAAAHALSSAQRALSMYEDLFGAYPHSRMVVVEGVFPDGMEFDGLVFVSDDWFRTFTGDPASYLTLITVHEVAHQWWYARVGNDAALNPYLDEALATYSEYIFLEEYYPQLREWWWGFRVDPYAPNGFVDSSIYQFSTIREYINAVYLRGVRMLHQLRQDLTTEVFFDWLRAYSDAGDGQIVTPRQFWSLLTPEQLAATQATREEYLSVPRVESMP
jgi:hypothetical protein